MSSKRAIRRTHCAMCPTPLPAPRSGGGNAQMYCSNACRCRAARMKRRPPAATNCAACSRALKPGRVDKRHCDEQCRNRGVKQARRKTKRRVKSIYLRMSPREALVMRVGWPGVPPTMRIAA